jgi:hypothetical protein
MCLEKKAKAVPLSDALQRYVLRRKVRRFSTTLYFLKQGDLSSSHNRCPSDSVPILILTAPLAVTTGKSSCTIFFKNEKQHVIRHTRCQSDSVYHPIMQWELLSSRVRYYMSSFFEKNKQNTTCSQKPVTCNTKTAAQNTAALFAAPETLLVYFFNG